jgi:hypothetical protein
MAKFEKITSKVLTVYKSICIKNLPLFIRDLIRFYLLFLYSESKRFEFSLLSLYPCLCDKSEKTNFDRHYIYHTAWAARVISTISPKRHIDISSILYFSTMLSAFVPVKFFDYRPASVKLGGLDTGRADLTSLRFKSNSIYCLSCMHTIEHIGLGRYGDKLDINGDLKAISELKRVLAQQGSLLLVVPIGGKPRIMFNAHRIYSCQQILDYFSDLVLKEFVLIPEDPKDGDLVKNPQKALLEKQRYGCGCFWFTKQ